VSHYVNYGTNIITVHQLDIFGGQMTSFIHEGEDGHEHLKPGEQCACGVLGIGIIEVES
jgi:hypothetical protein